VERQHHITSVSGVEVWFGRLGRGGSLRML
jgi:hypothetical protein